MRVQRGEWMYMFLNPEFYEDIRRYQPSAELRSIVKKMIDDTWILEPSGYWTYCYPKEKPSISNGWKIHLSARESTAEAILRCSAPTLISNRVSFKFCSDQQMVRMSCYKLWARTNGGKFITIYPLNEAEFLFLLEQLDEITKGFEGPYILTDRPYKQSKTVFYRFGGHRVNTYIDAHGYTVGYYLSPDGQVVTDERVPYFRIPEWVKDPVTRDFSNHERPLEVQLNGRYRVMSALRFSNFGGLYGAIDEQDAVQVVVREGRPNIHDRTSPLHPLNSIPKEARLLKKLEHTHLVPKCLEVFEEGGHIFLVQERLRAQSLWSLGMDLIFFRCRTPGELFVAFREVFRKICAGLDTIHEHGFVLRDLTRTNVLFTTDDEENIKFIDFELSYELGSDNAEPAHGWTAGYASPEQRANHAPAIEQDYYALGALILDAICVTASGLLLNREGVLQAFKQSLEDIGLPLQIAEGVEMLLQTKPDKRWTPKMFMDLLDHTPVPDANRTVLPQMNAERPFFPPPTAKVLEGVTLIREGVKSFILNTLDLARDDRLWPCTFYVFETNPVSFEYGASGIAAFLAAVDNRIPEGVMEWIIKRSDTNTCPPGLFNGLAGIAVFAAQQGRLAEAKQILSDCNGCVTARSLPGLFEGIAGIGLANLHLWSMTGKQIWLDEAHDIGKFLLSTRQQSSAGSCWMAEGIVPIGLGFGAAGISLFLTYLFAASGRQEFLAAAEEAILFEQAQAVRLGHGIVFYPQTDSSPGAPKSPHVRFGTAGVGSAALRLYMVSGKQFFFDFAVECARTCSIRFMNKLWQDYGLAGIGEFLIDMYKATGDRYYLNNAFYLAEGIFPHQIRKPQGIAFCATDFRRIGCDFGEGSAGIGFFMHRLLDPSLGRPFFLDSLLQRNRVPNSEAIETLRSGS